MSSKIIFIKDPHLAFGFQNRIRKDYERDVREKLDFVSNYALQNNINNIVFTGDVFDHQHERGWSFKQFKKNKEVLEEYFVNRGLQLWSVAGNHDFFHGEERIEGTVFGEMVQDGIINYLTREPLTIDQLTIYGIDWSANKDKVIAKLDEINKKEGLKAVVIHMNITDKPTPFTDFTKEFLTQVYPNIHVWVLGHYHVGQAPKMINNKLFIDPWNLVRVARDYDVKMDKLNINMTVLEVGDKLRAYDVDIPHRSFREAFIEDFVNMLQVGKKEIFKFFENINIEQVIEESASDDQLLDKLVIDAGISEAGKQRAIKYLKGE